MIRWPYRNSAPTKWTEELDAEETRRDVQPLIDRMFDPSKLTYIVEHTELGLVKQSDWIGAVLPGGPEYWDDIQRQPKTAHIMDIDYGACLMATIQARETEWMYTVLPSAWGLDHPWRESAPYIGIADRAWRWLPRRDLMCNPYVSGPYGDTAYGMSEIVLFDSSGDWFCVEDTERVCHVVGAPGFMADFFARCPGGETGLRWRGVEALNWAFGTAKLPKSEYALPAFEAFHIRRIDPRSSACARERMATLWPYEPATIPLGSEWDGPTPDDV